MRRIMIGLLCLLGGLLAGSGPAAAQEGTIEVLSMYWSPAGDKLVVLIVDRSIYENYLQIVDVQSREVLATLNYPATAAAWSPDGRRIAVNADLKLPEAEDAFYHTDHLVVTMLDAQTDEVLCQMEPDRYKGSYFGVGSLAWSPDGKTLAVDTGWYAGSDTNGGDTQLWNMEDCTRQAVLAENGYWTNDWGWGTTPAWNADGSELIFSTGWDIQIWKADPLQQRLALHSFAEGGGPAAWSVDGSKLALGNTGMILIVDSATGETLSSVGGTTNPDFVWTDDDQLLVSERGRLTVVDPMTGKNGETMEFPETARPFLSPDQQQVAFFDGQDIQIQPVTYTVEQDTPAAVQVEEADGTDDIGDVLWVENTIALLGQRGIWLYDDDLAQPPHLLRASGGTISHMVSSADGRYLIFPVNDPENRDFGVRVWDVAAGEVIRVLDGHTGEVTALDITNNLLVTGSTDQSVRVWDWTTGAQLQVLWGNGDTVLSVDISADGSLVTSSGGIHVWDVATGEAMSIDPEKIPDRFGSLGAIIRDAQFTPDGTGLVYYSVSERAQAMAFCSFSLGDNNPGSCAADHPLFKYPGVGPYYKVAFSPDGKQMIPYLPVYWGEYQNTLSLYPAETAIWGALSCLWGSGAVTFSPDGTLLAIGVANNAACDELPFQRPKSIWLWEAHTGAVKTIMDVEGLVDRLVFSPDGSRLLSISNEDRIALWEVSNGTQLAAVETFRHEVSENE